jgi:hypothetical protein
MRKSFFIVDEPATNTAHELTPPDMSPTSHAPYLDEKVSASSTGHMTSTSTMPSSRVGERIWSINRPPGVIAIITWGHPMMCCASPGPCTTCHPLPAVSATSPTHGPKDQQEALGGSAVPPNHPREDAESSASRCYDTTSRPSHPTLTFDGDCSNACAL